MCIRDRYQRRVHGINKLKQINKQNKEKKKKEKMEQSHIRINVDSEKSYLDFINDQWIMQSCKTVRHHTLLSKICIDERCKATNEQYQLICDKCIKENNTHKMAKENHKTIDLDLLLIQAIKQVFNNQNLSNQQNELDGNQVLLNFKQLLKNVLADLCQLESQIQEQISYVKSNIEIVESQIQNGSQGNNKDKEFIKQTVFQILKLEDQQVQQERVKELCKKVEIDANQVVKIRREGDFDWKKVEINIDQMVHKLQDEITKFKNEQSTLFNPTHQYEFFRIMDVLLEQKQFNFDSRANINEMNKYYKKIFQIPYFESYMSKYQPQQKQQIDQIKFDQNLFKRLQKLSEIDVFYPATLMIGYLYFVLILCQRDNAKAFQHFQKANQQAGSEGCAVAQRWIGFCYEKGYGIEKNEEESTKWFQKSADQGFSIGQQCLSYNFILGIGTQKDEKKAFYYAKLSSDQGCSAGQNQLGYCYYQGIGVEKNLQKGFELYKLAADQGNSYGQSNVGYGFENGYGCQKDLEKAKFYYQKAAEQGHQDAKKRLEELNNQQ
eukprot:TRINITY_DN627_c0_g1_i6.p1 TRINITY_DN627_c0_g1~~TRINITY_DN627_c0_g1_i6.p1  ORF type:complete len:550 (-),score=133.43 TRINITY_DN627_c0_g1_i6:139-1788(-)